MAYTEINQPGLYDALKPDRLFPGGFASHATPLENFSHEGFRAIMPEGEYKADPFDYGPFEVWYAAHRKTNRHCWTGWDQKYQERQMGYVLWDLRRILDRNLLELFRRDGGPQEVTEPAGLRLRRSILYRTRLWANGGHGYWNWADRSRLVLDNVDFSQPSLFYGSIGK